MAVTDVLPLDEFVDLYKMLDIAPTASEADLRERVNQLYLEAQRNIDHHNFRKRFYYQQLYEVHLPQAHQLLLDDTRRAEYDRFLDAFNKGEPFPEDSLDAGGVAVSTGDLGRTDTLSQDMIPTMAQATAAAPTIPPTSAAPVHYSADKTGQSRQHQHARLTAKPKPVTPIRPATPTTPKRTAPSSPVICFQRRAACGGRH